MMIDISDFVKEVENSIILKNTIEIKDRELYFCYTCLNHNSPDPFSYLHDPDQKIFYIKIKENTFPFGSCVQGKSIELPKDIRKIILKNDPTSELSEGERIEHFFPNLRKEE